jgi:hypothetical protein
LELSFSLGTDFNFQTINLSYKQFLRRGLLYGSYVQEVIVKILAFLFNYYDTFFHFRTSSGSRKILQENRLEGSKRMATKRRIRVAFNSLTITFLFMRRNCLCHKATSKKIKIWIQLLHKKLKGLSKYLVPFLNEKGYFKNLK